MYLIKDLRLNIKAGDEEVRAAIAAALKVSVSDITNLRLHKSSIDARRKSNITKVCSYYFECVTGTEVLMPCGVSAAPVVQGTLLSEDSSVPLTSGMEVSLPAVPLTRPDKPVLVVGSGPAGLFAAYTLVKAGVPTILIERGYDVDKRRQSVDKLMTDGVLDPVSNIQFGEGGAGTFSDGKLNTGIKNERCNYIKEVFCKFGAPEGILHEARPHIGTDKLVNVIKNIRNELIRLGCDIRFETKLEDISVIDNKILNCTLHTVQCTLETIEVHSIVLAIGHSARDTYHMLSGHKIIMQAKPFSIGARIEHSQKMINRSQYGDTDIGQAADYKLSCHLKDKDVYTFCMCPGGTVVPAASEEGGVVTNGMSEYNRSGRNANSALLVNVMPADFNNDALAGIEFQRKYERAAYALTGSFKAPVQTVGDFLSGQASAGLGDVEPTYLSGVVPSDLSKCLPDFAVRSMREAIKIFDNKLKGFAHSGAILTGVETRSSSPVRILRNEKYMSNIEGLYPCGEGAGYAGGIMSSAVDGITVAEAIIKRLTEVQIL